MKPGALTRVGDTYHVDSDFLRWSSDQIRGMILDHAGFGDFVLAGNSANVRFIRTGAGALEGGTGRDHEMHGDPTTIGILIGMWNAATKGEV